MAQNVAYGGPYSLLDLAQAQAVGLLATAVPYSRRGCCFEGGTIACRPCRLAGGSSGGRQDRRSWMRLARQQQLVQQAPAALGRVDLCKARCVDAGVNQLAGGAGCRAGLSKLWRNAGRVPYEPQTSRKFSRKQLPQATRPPKPTCSGCKLFSPRAARPSTCDAAMPAPANGPNCTAVEGRPPPWLAAAWASRNALAAA